MLDRRPRSAHSVARLQSASTSAARFAARPALWSMSLYAPVIPTAPLTAPACSAARRSSPICAPGPTALLSARGSSARSVATRVSSDSSHPIGTRSHAARSTACSALGRQHDSLAGSASPSPHGSRLRQSTASPSSFPAHPAPVSSGLFALHAASYTLQPSTYAHLLLPPSSVFALSRRDHPRLSRGAVRKRGSEATPPSGGDARGLCALGRGALVTWRSGGNASLPC